MASSCFFLEFHSLLFYLYKIEYGTFFVNWSFQMCLTFWHLLLIPCFHRNGPLGQFGLVFAMLLVKCPLGGGDGGDDNDDGGKGKEGGRIFFNIFFWQKKCFCPVFDARGNKNMGATILIGKEIQGLPYAGFFLKSYNLQRYVVEFHHLNNPDYIVLGHYTLFYNCTWPDGTSILENRTSTFLHK